MKRRPQKTRSPAPAPCRIAPTPAVLLASGHGTQRKLLIFAGVAFALAMLARWSTDAPFNGILFMLGLLWAFPSLAIYLASRLSHGRLRFGPDRLYLRAEGALRETEILLDSSDAILATRLVPPSDGGGAGAWGVVRRPRSGDHHVICGCPSYEDARRMAKAICRAAHLPFGSWPSQKVHESGRIPVGDVDALYCQHAGSRSEGRPARREPQSHGIVVSSTHDGGTAYRWPRLSLGVLRGHLAWVNLAVVLLGFATFGLLMMLDGYSWRDLRAVAGLAVVGAAVFLGSAWLGSARLVVSSREVRHQVNFAGIPVHRRVVVTDKVEDIEPIHDLLAVSDDRHSLMVRTWEDERSNQENVEWLAAQVRQAVLAAQASLPAQDLHRADVGPEMNGSEPARPSPRRKA